MKRRDFLKLSAGVASAAALLLQAHANTGVKEIRIGSQKTGVLVIARQQAVLEKKFAARQIGIKWIEFTSGAVAGSDERRQRRPRCGRRYAADLRAGCQPTSFTSRDRRSPTGRAFWSANSGIQTIAGLKGKRVGFTRAAVPITS